MQRLRVPALECQPKEEDKPKTGDKTKGTPHMSFPFVGGGASLPDRPLFLNVMQEVSTFLVFIILYPFCTLHLTLCERLNLMQEISTFLTFIILYPFFCTPHLTLCERLNFMQEVFTFLLFNSYFPCCIPHPTLCEHLYFFPFCTPHLSLCERLQALLKNAPAASRRRHVGHTGGHSQAVQHHSAAA